jgi:hypothetical protein
MKPSLSLRFLCTFSFVLLICPFYDSCNGRGFKKTEESAVEEPVEKIENVIDNSNIIEFNIKDLVIEQPLIEISILERFYDLINDKNTQNAYDFAYIFFDLFERKFQDLKKDAIEGIKNNNFKGLFFNLKNLSFFWIIIFTLLLLTFSFTKKINFILKLSKLILILLVITIFCIFLEGFFENVSQIKWGYYSFISINILIFFNIKKLLSSTMS